MPETNAYVLIKALGVPDRNGRIVSPEVMHKALQSDYIQKSIKNNSCYVYAENTQFPGTQAEEDRLARIEELSICEENGVSTLRASLSAISGKLPFKQVTSVSARDNNIQPKLHIRGFAKIEDNIVQDLKIISFDLCSQPDLE